MAGRPHKYDLDLVLEKAMLAFWIKGYGGTSMADLMEATGLYKGSLYQAFGDKHSLFIAAVTRYLENMERDHDVAMASASNPLEALSAGMHFMINLAASESPAKGCLAINTLVENVPHDDQVAQVIAEHMGKAQERVSGHVQAGQAQGLITKDLPAEAITLLLMTFVAGLSAVIKGPVNAEQAHQLGELQLQSVRTFKTQNV